MELFHEYHNRFFTALVELAERIASGETISASEFERIYYEIGSGGHKRIGETFLEQIRHNIKMPLFDFSDRKAVKLAFDAKSEKDIANIPLKAERIWFEAALCDSYAALFYDEDTIRSLRDSTADGSVPYYRLIDNSVCDMTPEDLQTVKPIFRQILDAVLAGQDVQFIYDDNTVAGKPLRIIYDEKDTSFSLLIEQGSAAKIFEMSKIKDFRSLETAEQSTVSVRQLMSQYKAAEPIVIEITDKQNRNAIERAVISFSVYDHIVRLTDKKTAEITINYYQFDLDDIVRRILSFGTDAFLKSPEAAREHLKKILRLV